MLKDRIILIEKEIEHLKHTASECYLKMIQSPPETTALRQFGEMKQYETIKEKLYGLIMDRDIVKSLIEQSKE